MKTILITLLVLHALVHGLSFSQAAGPAKVDLSGQPVTLFAGILWLTAGISLLATAGAWAMDFRYWWVIGGVALLLSQWLIHGSWTGTKWGTVPNVLLLLAIGWGYATTSFDNHAENVRKELLQTASTVAPIKPRRINALPLPVQKWLDNSGALRQVPPRWVSLRQTVSMKLAAEQQKWYSARAEQVVSLRPPAFQWVVQMRMNVLAHVSGQDVFSRGRGTTQMKLWGLIPVANAEDNPQTNEAALQRYLAEMVWYPQAAGEEYVTWTPIDHLTARATISTDGVRGSGVFHFNEAGEVVKFTAQRFREAGPAAERAEWTVNILETGILDGVRVPLSARVSWRTPEGIWTWLEMKVTYLAYHYDGARTRVQ